VAIQSKCETLLLSFPSNLFMYQCCRIYLCAYCFGSPKSCDNRLCTIDRAHEAKNNKCLLSDLHQHANPVNFIQNFLYISFNSWYSDTATNIFLIIITIIIIIAVHGYYCYCLNNLILSAMGCAHIKINIFLLLIEIVGSI
jgi:hypothetical protein